MRSFFLEIMQHRGQNWFIIICRDCSVLVDIVLIQKTLTIEEDYHHNLISTATRLCFFRRWRLRRFPLRTLLFELRIIVIHSQFIYDPIHFCIFSPPNCDNRSWHTVTRYCICSGMSKRGTHLQDICRMSKASRKIENMLPTVMSRHVESSLTVLHPSFFTNDSGSCIF